MRGHIKYILQRLSLRKPQNEALASLAKFLEINNQTSDPSSLKSLSEQFPGFKEFERDFPNICFSLATGVGKTRLMGAMISYLYLAKRVRDILIIAPNSTILEKLINDFSNPNHEKYVFLGIAEFAVKKPKIITAENYEQGYGVRNSDSIRSDLFNEDDDLHINIFNIAKMHSDKRKIKEINDYLDVSYYDYLSSLDDLVIFMDEAHQYRAHAAMKTLSELNPHLGIELTATPQIERSGKSSRFKNIVYDYPLSAALKDGFLKEPAVAGRENFNINNYQNEEELDRLKIEDGIRLHEQTKLHLQAYSQDHNDKLVKPLMLIVAQDTKHADALRLSIESDQFFDGDYKDKVLVVHSEVKADAEERMIRELLDVENPNSPIEIVIHVNMLREGWDIVNLYTMVPLRKANSKTLIEQNLGRGLRLPFRKLTGIKEIDTHTVVSHDRFNEIIDSANKDDSIIRRGVLIGKDVSLDQLEMVDNCPLEQIEIDRIANEEERLIAQKTFEAVHSLGLESTNEILDYVKTVEVNTANPEFESTVKKYIEKNHKHSMLIPRIRIEPKVLKEGKFQKFVLNTEGISIKPFGEGIVVQGLMNGDRKVYNLEHKTSGEDNLEIPLIMHLLNFDDIAENEDNNEVVEDCVIQLVSHLRSYLADDSEVEQVIRQQGQYLAKLIHHQMMDNFEDPLVEWEETVAEKLMQLKTLRLPSPKGRVVRKFNHPVENKLNIREMIFEGFKKSLYSLVKFDSDSERVFSVILEQDPFVQKWLKPTRGQFDYIHYTKDYQYVPDFIVEAQDEFYLVEIKRRSDLDIENVITKAKAAQHWCQLASKHAADVGSKPWTYVLIPHDQLHLTMTLQGLVAAHTYNKFRELIIGQ